MPVTWQTWLTLAMVLTLVAALTGIKARGTRHVARTKLMTAARVVLIAAAALGLYLALAAHAAT